MSLSRIPKEMPLKIPKLFKISEPLEISKPFEISEPFKKNLKRRTALLHKKIDLLDEIGKKIQALLKTDNKEIKVEKIEDFKDEISVLQNKINEILLRDPIYKTDIYKHCENKITKDEGKNEIEAVKLCHKILLDPLDETISDFVSEYRAILRYHKLQETNQFDNIDTCLAYIEKNMKHCDPMLNSILEIFNMEENKEDKEDKKASIAIESINHKIWKMTKQMTMEEAEHYADAAKLQLDNDEKYKNFITSIEKIRKSQQEIYDTLRKALDTGISDESEDTSTFDKALTELVRSLDFVGHLFAEEVGKNPTDLINEYSKELRDKKIHKQKTSANFIINSFCKLLEKEFESIEEVTEQAYNLEYKGEVDLESKEEVDSETLQDSRFLKDRLTIIQKTVDSGQKQDLLKDLLHNQEFRSLRDKYYIIINNKVNLDESTYISYKGTNNYEVYFSKYINSRNLLYVLRVLNETCETFESMEAINVAYREAKNELESENDAPLTLQQNYPFFSDTRNELKKKISEKFENQALVQADQMSMLELLKASNAEISGITQDDETTHGYDLQCDSTNNFKLMLISTANRIKEELYHINDKEKYKDLILNAKKLSDNAREICSCRSDNIDVLDGLAKNIISLILDVEKKATARDILWTPKTELQDRKILSNCIIGIKEVIEEEEEEEELPTVLIKLKRELENAKNAIKEKEKIEKINQIKINFAKAAALSKGKTSEFNNYKTKYHDYAVMLKDSERIISTILGTKDEWKNLHQSIIDMHTKGTSLKKKNNQLGNEFIDFSRELASDLRKHLREIASENINEEEATKNFIINMKKKLDEKKATVSSHRHIWYPTLTFISNCLAGLTLVGGIYMLYKRAWLFNTPTERAQLIEQTKEITEKLINAKSDKFIPKEIHETNYDEDENFDPDSSEQGIFQVKTDRTPGSCN